MIKEVVNNPRYPHHIRIVRNVVKDWLDDDEESEQTTTELVVYEGCGRSYTDTTTTGDKSVDVNKRKCSIPMRYDDWLKQNLLSDGEPMVPMSGDIVQVTKFQIHEEWEVKDFEPDNNRTVVYGEMNRTYNIK